MITTEAAAIYLDGWFADTFGPLIPWDTAGSAKNLAGWDSDKDKWELYRLDSDFSQADDLAPKNPEKLAELKAEFLKLAQENQDFPIGAGNWLRIHPQDRIKSDYNTWTFGPETHRMPEFAAPGVGRQNTRVTIDAEFGADSNGVLYAVGGAGRRPHRLYGQRRARVRIQHDDHRKLSGQNGKQNSRR